MNLLSQRTVPFRCSSFLMLQTGLIPSSELRMRGEEVCKRKRAIVLQAASLYGTPSVLCRCNWVYCILAAAFNQLKRS